MTTFNGYITIKNSNSPTFQSISQFQFDEIRNNLFHLNGRPVVMADIFEAEDMGDVQTLMDPGIHIDDARVVKVSLWQEEGKAMYAAAKTDYDAAVAEAEIVAQKIQNLRGDYTYAITDKAYSPGSLTMNGAAKGIEIDDFTMFTVTVYRADMVTEVAKFQEVNHFDFEEWLFENGYITRTRSTENCVRCGMYIAEEYGGVCERHPAVEQVIEYAYEPPPPPTAADEPF